ncbi:hypothetical protein QE152_g38725 [Popillia japonica]|uniref:Uncharacterized protein n=1 Tax=Popillia japonica TaxID=7064 RepID=A0AAW1HW08_POPJA
MEAFYEGNIPECKKIAMFLHALGDEGYEIYTSFNMKKKDRKRLKCIMDRFDEHFTLKVQAATRLCHPDDIRVSETYAEVKLQSLMDHTVTRLCKAQEEVIKAVNNLKTINIIVKWGCDGAEQNYYKQKLYCRPIKFVFAKETRDLIKGEV